MGLRVPRPLDKMDLWSAGYNGNGEFIVSTEGGQVVRVPDEWRVPLAAHLVADVGLFDLHSIRFLRELQVRAQKKRGGKLEADDAARLGEVAHALECLIHEYLEGSSTNRRRFQYRPSYPVPPGEDRAAESNLEPEEVDDTPAPWEAAKV